MKKGVSETISLVLIMAIVVISAAILYLWGIPLFSKGAGVQYYSVHIDECNGSHVYVVNEGPDGIAASRKTSVDVYMKGSYSWAADLDLSGLAVGNPEWRELGTPLASGEYYIADENLPESPFNC